jgi:hypothetical protein
MLRRSIIIAATSLFVVGCTDADERTANTFSYFPALAKHVQQANKLTLYEGLPHPTMDPDGFEKERNRTDTIGIDGHRFYKAPVAVSDETLESLRSLSVQQGLFKPFQAAKACGGFHPDWCLVWTDAEKEVDVHFCFGCNEVAAFVDGERQMLCEMQNDEPFKELLDALRTNRTSEDASAPPPE